MTVSCVLSMKMDTKDFRGKLSIYSGCGVFDKYLIGDC